MASYEKFMAQKPDPENVLAQYIGWRVRLTASHPHSGETGIFTGVENTIIGKLPHVKLDDSDSGESGCYVTSPKDWIILGPAKSTKRK